jgi:hypothetical protein
LKIASSGRGAFAGTRCAHFNSRNKEWACQQPPEVSEKIDTGLRSQVYEELVERRSNSPIFQGKIGSLASKEPPYRFIALKDWSVDIYH